MAKPTILFLCLACVMIPPAASIASTPTELSATSIAFAEKPLAAPLSRLIDPSDTIFEAIGDREARPAMPPAAANTAESQSVWEAVQNNLTLSFDPDRPRIAHERARYTRNNARYLQKITERAEPHLYHIVNALKNADLPLELAALPIIESAYNSTAKSRQGAVGLWQFIRPTAKQFGLKKNGWYDGRRDTIASTQAAIDYLSHLAEQYDGDWLLALSAYNAGERTINRAIKRNLKAGRPTDYWHLKLPAETMRYVPRFLAAVSLIQSPEFYEVELAPVANQPYFEAVTVSGRTSLQKLARKIDADNKTILALNAGLRFGVTPANRETKILLPIDAASKFLADRDELENKIQIAAVQHRVERGETLSHISKRYGIPVTQIKASNQLSNSRIRVGQTLHIPES